MVAPLACWKSKFQLSTLRAVNITGLYGCSRAFQASVVVVIVTVYPSQAETFPTYAPLKEDVSDLGGTVVKVLCYKS